MSRTISDRLSEVAKTTFVGRRRELEVLRSAIEAAELPFVVIFIHGLGGIGKTRLLQKTLTSVGSQIHSIVMDCHEIEPTPNGFLAVLGATLRIQESEPKLCSIVACLGNIEERFVLALDNYETFGLMDTWLRQVFIPALPQTVLTIIISRQTPNAAWLTTPGWEGLFCEIKLQELPDGDARQMLNLRGLTQLQVERVNRFACGYPLALELAAAALRNQPDLEIVGDSPPKVLQQLTRFFLAGLPSETTEAVEAASTVRRVTEPVLKTLLDMSYVKEVFEKLQDLPFINATSEGLIFHDVVRDTIANDLARRNPERYRMYRTRLWRYLADESHRTWARNLWQCTADLLYLIENPAIREAFFPKGGSDYMVEPATLSDGKDICGIASDVEPEESAWFIERWWNRHPETFSVARARNGKVEAFFILFPPTGVDPELLADDPLTNAWSQHLRMNPVAEGERVLFLRRWLTRTSGEAPSPAQAACWLDVKRNYMELRPSLRRLYTAVTNLAIYAPIVGPLGFVPIENSNAAFSGATYHTAMLDFGEFSVDGWLRRLIGAELGIGSAQTGTATGSGSERGRFLVTVLFTDIVSATERAAQLGDRQWRDLLERHHAAVRRELARFLGREIDTAGDGFLATFDAPARAIHCACAISEKVRELGIEIRAGLHIGECEMMEGKVSGIAVHIGARVAAMARSGEVLVSSTLKDLVAGSDIRFDDRGSHVLKGLPGEWRLFAVKREVGSKAGH